MSTSVALKKKAQKILNSLISKDDLGDENIIIALQALEDISNSISKCDPVKITAKHIADLKFATSQLSSRFS